MNKLIVWIFLLKVFQTIKNKIWPSIAIERDLKQWADIGCLKRIVKNILANFCNTLYKEEPAKTHTITGWVSAKKLYTYFEIDGLSQVLDFEIKSSKCDWIFFTFWHPLVCFEFCELNISTSQWRKPRYAWLSR